MLFLYETDTTIVSGF